MVDYPMQFCWDLFCSHCLSLPPPSPYRHDIVFVQPLRQGKRQYCSILIRLGGLYVQNDILVKCPRCGALNMAIQQHHFVRTVFGSIPIIRCAGDMYVGPPPWPWAASSIAPHSSPLPLHFMGLLGFIRSLVNMSHHYLWEFWQLLHDHEKKLNVMEFAP